MEIPPEVRYAVREGKSIAYQRFGSGNRRLVTVLNERRQLGPRMD